MMSRSGMLYGLLPAAGLLLAAAPAAAKQVTVTVDARSGPWLVSANPKLGYGVGDARPPAIVTGWAADADGRLSIMPSGTTSVRGRDGVGPAGNDAVEANDGKGPHHHYYPSLYAPKVLYPAYAHALMATFVDAGGAILGRPFVVGEGVRVPILPGAAGLALGFNDETAAGNAGSLSVIVEMPDD